MHSRSIFVVWSISSSILFHIAGLMDLPQFNHHLKNIWVIASHKFIWTWSFLIDLDTVINLINLRHKTMLNWTWTSNVYVIDLLLYESLSSVAQLCTTLCDLMDCSTPGLPVHHQLPEFTQTHVLWVSDAIQISHPISSPSPPAFNLSKHQGLFKWVSSSHQVAKVLEYQL